MTTKIFPFNSLKNNHTFDKTEIVKIGTLLAKARQIYHKIEIGSIKQKNSSLISVGS